MCDNDDDDIISCGENINNSNNINNETHAFTRSDDKLPGGITSLARQEDRSATGVGRSPILWQLPLKPRHSCVRRLPLKVLRNAKECKYMHRTMSND